MAVERTKSIRDKRPVYKTSSGEMVPGVTTITGLRMKDALIQWAFNVGKENPHLYSARQYTDDLADIGKCAHAIISAHLREVEADMGDYAPNVVKAAQFPVDKFLEWKKGKKIEVIFADSKELVSDTHRYGGTVDLLAKIDGLVTVLDFKTGKAIYDEMFYQVAAYAGLVEECVGLKVDQIRILQIGRVGAEGFTERVMSNWERELRWFLAMREVYQIEKDMESAKKLDSKVASGKVIQIGDYRPAEVQAT